MTGRTHLAIGAAIGAAAAVYYSPGLEDAAVYIGVAAFSALSADLDGPSMLSSKLTKLSKRIRELALGFGILYLVMVVILYATGQPVNPVIAGGGIAALLLGLVMKQGFVRNALVSLAGLYIVYCGLAGDRLWMLGLGLFVVIAPWLKHRGLTHTIWVVPLWWWLGIGLERELDMEGIAAAAALGYLSHLAADTLTPSGVRWLYPLVKKPLKLKL